MKIYLAARYSRREELLDYKADLEAGGHTITSRWLDGNHQIPNKELVVEDNPLRVQFAIEDMDDVLEADCLIHFTEPQRTATRGGRHVEMGIAIGHQKRVIVVGPRENVFCCLPQVEWFENYRKLVI